MAVVDMAREVCDTEEKRLKRVDEAKFGQAPRPDLDKRAFHGRQP